MRQPSDCANDRYLSILWCRIDHPALLHKLNTVYDKIHTLGYNLTVQKHMSGFKTHQTVPAAKGIHVDSFRFDDIYECILCFAAYWWRSVGGRGSGIIMKQILFRCRITKQW